MSARRRTGLPRPLAAAAGIVLDRVGHEPPGAVHPVVLFGRAMTGVERGLYRDTRVAGVVHAATGAALGVGTGMALRSTSLATGLAVAGRSLADAAGEIGSALETGDLDRARSLLPTMVGRDPDGLDAKEMARAVVESVAENTVDGVIAPALWGGVAGAPGALGFRAVNTLDSMVGHRSPRYANYGWASARADDVLAFIPARLTAVLVGLVRPAAAGDVWRAVRTQAPAHPSPNSGVAEAAFAAALGLRLGGLSRYGGRAELRPPLGTGRAAEPADIARAVKLSLDVGAGMAVGLGTVGAWQWMRRIR
ncbi:MAG TPA: adenosylcobinamide-phosphate synthase CbiB [Acidimicrobiales bacterium]|jgi:adenosylcobinamide-phosphate synthase|nr:adenosylcobinamide-phosphate synthase CbiB [Acidimicrobiales bacterium]